MEKAGGLENGCAMITFRAMEGCNGVEWVNVAIVATNMPQDSSSVFEMQALAFAQSPQQTMEC